MVKCTVKPGQKVPDSGIYRDTSSGERATLVRGKIAPPTENRGGKWRVTALAPEQPQLAALVPSISASTAGYDAVLRLVIPEYPIFHALHDLAEAITQTHVAPTNCGRAIDGLRHAIAPSASRDEQWKTLRDNLQVEKAYLQIITDLSTGPRHGDPAHIPGPVVKDVVERTWIVMNRYFEFLKRGKRPLPKSEFPTLT
jgi:hypothetical protein